MEVLTSNNRMNATTSPDYYPNFNDPAATLRSEDLFVTFRLTLTFIVFCVFPLFTYFKDSIFWTFSHIGDSIHHTSLDIAYIFGLFKEISLQDHCV